MNQPLSQQFAEIVKAGKVPGLTLEYGGRHLYDRIVWTEETVVVTDTENDGWVETKYTPILCHHIREWLTEQGIEWELYPKCLSVGNWPQYVGCDYRNGPELDWHLAAVVDICAGKVTP